MIDMFRGVFNHVSRMHRPQILRCLKRNESTLTHPERSLILGIETSCDETGAAVVDCHGNIISESLHSQLQTHLSLGGIIPPLARDLHAENIENVVQSALAKANIDVSQLAAVAATVKPGLPLSLAVGTNYAKALCKQFNKKFIPIHHMEAHALTARMVEQVDFPFLVLLVSGGHCLLAIAHSVEEFHRLGESIDLAPGDALDKVARRLKLRNISEYSSISGGRAVELLARKGNISAFDYKSPLSVYKDCSFSFSGLGNGFLRHLLREEKRFGIEADVVLPNVADFCASFQHAVVSHICKRLQRGMVYVDEKNLIPKESRKLVVSGGVACNEYLRDCLGIVCNEMGYTLVTPPPKLCTDNGIMIAWNGMEKWKAQVGIVDDIDAVKIDAKAKLGTDISKDVENSKISCKWIKLTTKNLTSPPTSA